MKKILLFVGLATSIQFSAFAQVGIDNPLPDPHSILDLKAIDKGLLIPRMTTAQRFTILSNCNSSCPSGLLVYDTDKKGLFYLDANQWFLMSPFIAPDALSGAPEVVRTDNLLVSDMGIGTTPGVGVKLQVKGNVKINENLVVTNNTTIETGNLAVTTGNITAGGPVNSLSSIAGTGALQGSSYGTSTFRTDGSPNFSGPVPRGGIIMWSGTTGNIPAGWALCDGANGTPDLRERFVVGAGGDNTTVSDGTGYTVNSTGGTNRHTLSMSEIPNHNHGGSTNTAGAHTHNTSIRSRGLQDDDPGVPGLEPGSGGTNSVTSNSAGDHSHTISSQGGDQPHENRPPYFALAFIMKL